MKTTSIGNLYLIHTKSLCHAHEQWLDDFEKKHVCSECKRIKPEMQNKKIDVFLMEKPDKAAVNTVYPPGIDIVRTDFLDLFASELSECLDIGKVYINDATIVEGFVTFAGKRSIFLRGSKESSFRGVCQSCGQLRYLPQYPWYVMKESLIDQNICQAYPLSGLIITGELKDRIEKGKWKGICITKLPVIDKPRDGIEDFPYDLKLSGGQLCKIPSH